MKSRPGQGLTVISKKIRLKQNDHASRRTQRSPHTRRDQNRPSPSPTLAAIRTAQAQAPHSPQSEPPKGPNGPSAYRILAAASATSNAVILTIRRTVAE